MPDAEAIVAALCSSLCMLPYIYLLEGFVNAGGRCLGFEEAKDCVVWRDHQGRRNRQLEVAGPYGSCLWGGRGGKCRRVDIARAQQTYAQVSTHDGLDDATQAAHPSWGV
jgi:hypothetical protein